MGFDVLRIELVDERRLVVAFVGTDAFGGAGGLGGFDIDDQAVAIIGQGVGDVTQFGLGVFAFLVKPGSGSVVLWWVALLRFSPLKLTSGSNRPAQLFAQVRLTAGLAEITIRVLYRHRIAIELHQRRGVTFRIYR